VRWDASQWLRWESRVAELAWVKRSESGRGLVARIVERENRRGRGYLAVPPKFSRVFLTTLLEDLEPSAIREQPMEADHKVAVEIRPYQIVTILMLP
jgi:hypothetical protein